MWDIIKRLFYYCKVTTDLCFDVKKSWFKLVQINSFMLFFYLYITQWTSSGILGGFGGVIELFEIKQDRLHIHSDIAAINIGISPDEKELYGLCKPSGCEYFLGRIPLNLTKK